ncbi:hypothetical protein EON66_08140 [archaeon]|nr:MAG: hypothetical protein EON66_08140 [archaeon]
MPCCSSYLVYQEGASTDASSETLFTQALVNALVIVGVIIVATFVMVLCYYFRCIKVLVAYLIFASVMLLGYSGGFMVMTALQVWRIVSDYGAFVFIMYNFAIGGALAVFWQKGVPRIITQGYLVLVSVIMSWILTKLPEVRVYACVQRAAPRMCGPSRPRSWHVALLA